MMEWQALPQVNWWIIIGGVAWAVICVAMVFLLVWAGAQLRRQFGRFAAQALGLILNHYARERIACAKLVRLRTGPGNTPGASRKAPRERTAVSQ